MATKRKNTFIENAAHIKVRLTFQEPILGTSTPNPEILEKYKFPNTLPVEQLKKEIEEISRAPIDEEAAENGIEDPAKITVFPRNENGDLLFKGYQFKGFFKDACGGLREIKSTKFSSKSSKLTSYKKKIDKLVFITSDLQNFNPAKEKMTEDIIINYEGDLTICSRPLRASTAQGERIALAHSEQIAEGATCEFDIVLLDPNMHDVVIEWMDYGAFSGMGQWRNSSKGRFTYEILEDSTEDVA